MLEWLTPAERRGAVVLVVLLLLGAAHDGCRARRMRVVSGAATASRYDPTLTLSMRPARDPEPGLAGGAPRVTTVDLNRASSSDLERLPGIGPVLASRIVAHRDRFGPFRRAEELLGVRGIGPRLFARLDPLVWVAESTGSGAQVGIRRAEGRSRRFVHSAQSGRGGRADSTSVDSSSFR